MLGVRLIPLAATISIFMKKQQYPLSDNTYKPVFMTLFLKLSVVASTVSLIMSNNLYSFVIAQKIKFSVKDFFSKCDQIRSYLRIWSHLLKKSLNGKHHFLCSVWCDTRVLWNKGLFHSCINALTHFMVAFYCIILTLSCFQITKMEDERSSHPEVF